MSCFKNGSKNEINSFKSFIKSNYRKLPDWNRKKLDNNLTIKNGVEEYIKCIDLVLAEINDIKNELIKIFSEYEITSCVKDDSVSLSITQFLKNPGENYFINMVKSEMKANYSFFLEVLENLTDPNCSCKLENLQNYRLFMHNEIFYGIEKLNSFSVGFSLEPVDIFELFYEQNHKCEISLDKSTKLPVLVTKSFTKRIMPNLPNLEGTCYFNAVMIFLYPILKIIESKPIKEVEHDEYLMALKSVFNLFKSKNTSNYSILKKEIQIILNKKEVTGGYSPLLVMKTLNLLLEKKIIGNNFSIFPMGFEKPLKGLKCSSETEVVVIHNNREKNKKMLESRRLSKKTQDIRFRISTECKVTYPLLFSNGGEYFKLKSMIYYTPVVFNIELKKSINEYEVGTYVLQSSGKVTFANYSGERSEDLSSKIWNDLIDMTNLLPIIKEKLKIYEENFLYPFSREKLMYDGIDIYYVDQQDVCYKIPRISNEIEVYSTHTGTIIFEGLVPVRYDDNYSHPKTVDPNKIWNYNIESLTYKKIKNPRKIGFFEQQSKEDDNFLLNFTK